MTKGLKIALGILAGTAVVGLGLWFYKKHKEGSINDDGSVNGDTIATDPNLETGNVAATTEQGALGIPTSTPISEPSLAPETLPLGTFPINFGDKNARVQQIQKTFGIAADGILGKQTRGALAQKGYQLPLDEKTYDKVVSKKWYWGYPYKSGQSVYANNDLMVYAKPASFSNKTLVKASDKPFGVFGAFVPEQIGWIAISFAGGKTGYVSLVQKGLKIK
jgi:hypothetical protein